MAINLTAKISLVDKFTDPIKKMERHTRMAEKAMKSMESATKKTSNSTKSAGTSMQRFTSNLGKVGSKAKSAAGSFGSLNSTIFGIAAAYGAATAAQKTFQATVGEAMKYEMSSVTIDAMFNDAAIGKKYRDMIEKIAIESPILNSQEILSSSRGFITKSKDLKDLEKMARITEKLAAYDPIQGTEGAAFALNELMSGDAVSLQERFELSRSALKPIKDIFADGNISKGLAEMDKYLEKIGISNKLISDMGDTTAGKLAQVKEQWAVMLRQMGEPSLEVLANFFDNILTRLNSEDMARFANVGANIIQNILTGLSNAAVKIYDWFVAIQNDPKFQEQSTLYGKVTFVIEDIYARFLSWLDSGGKEKIEKTTSDIMQLVIGGLEANIDAIEPVAARIGSAIGNGIINAAKGALSNSWLMKAIKDPVGYATKVVTGGLVDLGDPYTGKGFGINKAGNKSHASGISRVPYNGYQATLHKNERVLTPEETKEYENGGKGGVNVSFAGAVFNVRQESDIQSLAYALANEIRKERGGMANV